LPKLSITQRISNTFDRIASVVARHFGGPILIVSAVILLGVSVAIFIFGEGKEYLLGIVTNVVSQFLAVVATRTQKGKRAWVYKSFQPNQFFDDVRHARKIVRIMDIWLWRILEDSQASETFRQALRHAIRTNKIKVLIVVTHPRSVEAEARAKELTEPGATFGDMTPEDLRKVMVDKTELLLLTRDVIHREVLNRDTMGAQFEVVLTDKAPNVAMYQVDDMVRWNFFKNRQIALDGVQHIFIDTPGNDLVALFDSMFEDIWKGGVSTTLAEFESSLALTNLDQTSSNRNKQTRRKPAE
jgi:hypothetical protein